MSKSNTTFSIEVEDMKAVCPLGEVVGNKMISEERIPVIIVPKNLRPFDPSDHDMVERPRSVYS